MALSIKEWRLIKQISIEEMSSKCGVHWNTYKAWESHPEKITIENGLKIANALGVPFDSIFFTANSTKCSDSTKGGC